MRLPAFFLTWLLLAIGSAVYAEQETTVQQEEQESVSAEEVEPVPQLPRADLAGRNQQALIRLEQQYPQQLVELQDADSSFAALFLPANSRQPLGQVILLPDLQQPADAPGAIDMLRHSIPDKGWHSLALHLPDTEFVAMHISPLPVIEPPSEPVADELSDDILLPKEVQKDEDAAESESEIEQAQQEQIEQDAEQAAPSFTAQMSQQLELALDYQHAEQHNRLVLLAVGESAALALEFLQAQPKQAAKIEHLLLLNPLESQLAQSSLEQLIQQSNLPITEFIRASNNSSQQAAQQRRNAGKRKAKGSYQQVLLEPYAHDPAAQANKRIVGWLYNYSRKLQ